MTCSARLTPGGKDGAIHRTKNRVVMGSRGSQLFAAESVKELLMGIYDGVEGTLDIPPLLFSGLTNLLVVHRALVNGKDYLHRDVSVFNFLIYPKHLRETLKRGLIDNPPKFINDILGSSK